MNRRELLAMMPLVMMSPAQAGQDIIYVVNGAITESNYAGFEQFLFNSLDTVVGLKLNVERDESTQTGLVASASNDGQFVAYMAGGQAKAEIVANAGFSYLHGDYVFDGFFVVKSGGMHQGVISLFLDKADEAQVRLSNSTLVQIQANRLNSKHKKKT